MIRRKTALALAITSLVMVASPVAAQGFGDDAGNAPPGAGMGAPPPERDMGMPPREGGMGTPPPPERGMDTAPPEDINTPGPNDGPGAAPTTRP